MTDRFECQPENWSDPPDHEDLEGEAWADKARPGWTRCHKCGEEWAIEDETTCKCQMQVTCNKEREDQMTEEPSWRKSGRLMHKNGGSPTWSFRMDPAEAERVERLIKLLGITKTAFLLEAVKQLLDEEELLIIKELRKSRERAEALEELRVREDHAEK